MSSDFAIERQVNSSKLYWPDEEECEDEYGLGGNRAYCDLRGFSFQDVATIIEIEKSIIENILEFGEYNEVMEEVYDTDDISGFDDLFGLDVGIASSVVALSALGCVPFSSCNGGEFGGTHSELYPLVAFFAQPRHVSTLLEAAEKCDVGLVNGEHETRALVLYSPTTQPLRHFALQLAKTGGNVDVRI